MNTIELIVTASSIIVALCIALIAFVLLKPRKEQIEAKEQVTIEAKLKTYDETPKLKARIEYLESEIEKFVKICDEMTEANKKYLDYFEEYVRLTQGELVKPTKRSVTSLKKDECIRIGDGDWTKLAPLFEKEGIKWYGGQKPHEIEPGIGWCVQFDFFGKNELTRDEFDANILQGLTVLPASDFIED